MTRIGVVDYGAGNLVSIEQALTTVGGEVSFVREPGDLDPLDALVVPGVGAAAPAMAQLTRRGLAGPIRHWIVRGRPYLGICLGLQLLFETSDEDGAEMLAMLPGRVTILEDAPTLPHIGWNQVERRREHALFAGIPDGTDFYFVHSYAGLPTGIAGEASILAETRHGRPFVSAIDQGNVLGVQFHPERSAGPGLRLLANFVGWATALSAGDGPALSAAGAGSTSGGH